MQMAQELHALGILDTNYELLPGQRINLQLCEVLYRQELQRMLPGVTLPTELWSVIPVVDSANNTVHMELHMDPATQRFFNQHLNSQSPIAVRDAFEQLHGIDTTAALPANPQELQDGSGKAELHFDRLLSSARLLIRQLRDELKLIAREKKRNAHDKQAYAALVAREVDLRKRLYGAQDGSSKGLIAMEAALSKLDPTLGELQVYFEQDMNRVAELLQRRGVNDLREAGRILAFYAQVGTFDVNKPHPLFRNEDIYDAQGNLLLPDGTVRYLQGLRARAEKMQVIVDFETRKRVLEAVNSDPRVQQTHGRALTAEEIFAQAAGLKDITWLDQMLMDPANGILSAGHVITQRMMQLLTETVDGKVKEADVLIQELDAMQKELEAELKRLGFSYAVPFVKGVSYDIFFAKDKNGFQRGELIQRFTAEWEDAFQAIEERTRQAISTAYALGNSKAQRKAIQQAHEARCRWLEEHTVMVRPHLLAELVQDPEFAGALGANPHADPAHRQELVNLLGQHGYEEMLESQRKRLRTYITERALLVENLMAQAGVSDEASLPVQDQRAIRGWERKNNPTQIADFLDSRRGLTARNPMGSEYQFCHFVPRKTKAAPRVTPRGVEWVSTKQDTGFYDAQFAQIESNPILRKAHNLFKRMLEHASENLPPDVQEQLGREMSLPQMRKTFTELLMDENLHGLAKLSALLRHVLNSLKRLISEDFHESVSYARLDPLTGKPEYHVNTAWLRTHKAEVTRRHGLVMDQIVQHLPTLRKQKLHDLTQVPQAVLTLIAEQLGCAPTVEAIQRKFPQSDVHAFDIRGELRAAILHGIVQENSLDLPKLLRLHAHLAAMHGAREEALPMLTMMKRYYEAIPKRKTNLHGAEEQSGLDTDADGNPIAIISGTRHRANEQLEAWFQRAVLGVYGGQSELGDTSFAPGREMQGLRKLFHRPTGRVLTDKEKQERAQIDRAIHALENTVAEDNDHAEEIAERLNQLRRRRDNLGRRITPSSLLGVMFQWVRLIGLGWNYKSALTNYMEGQLSNMYAAMSGTYFTPENIYRANMIVRKSTIKMLTGGRLASKEARKLSVLMARFNVLQDSSNELQRASKQSFLNQVRHLDPYELTRRVEYKNQAPIMLAILFDTKITDVNGKNPVSVWDAMDDRGNLKPEYRTEENVKGWELCTSPEYHHFSTKVTKAIVNIHGDYHELRGMQATEFTLGKAVLMFKRWSARWVYTHWGKEQHDIELGRKTKGAYRSATAGTAGLLAGTVGFLALGPIGLLVAGAGGLLVGKLYGPRTDLNVIQDLLYQVIDTLKMSIRIPLNFLTGRNIIKGQSDESIMRRHGSADANGNHIDRDPKHFSQLDAENYRRNIAELATLMLLVALKLVAKGLMDDDEDEATKKWRNFTVNQLMQMSGQLQTGMNPVAIGRGYITEISVIRHLDNMRKTVGAMLDSDPDNPVAPRAKKLFFPFFSRHEAPASHQYQRDYTDSPEAFWGVAMTQGERARHTAETIRAIRRRYRLELMERGISDEKKLDRMVNSRYPTRRGEPK